MQYKTADLKAEVYALEQAIEIGRHDLIIERLIDVEKVVGELKSFIGFNVPVSGNEANPKKLQSGEVAVYCPKCKLKTQNQYYGIWHICNNCSYEWQ